MRQINGRHIVFPTFEISCVASAPDGGLCFGSEDGRLRFTKIDGPAGARDVTAVESGEAINGIAFSDNIMVVSTRQEIVVCKDYKDPVPTKLDRGAFGLIQTMHRRVVAGLGKSGIFMMQSSSEGGAGFSQVIEREPHIYQISAAGGFHGEDWIICAARRNGIVSLVVNKEEIRPVAGMAFREKGRYSDVIDVAPLTSVNYPHAAIGIGKDCEFHFVRDSFSPLPPNGIFERHSFSFPPVKGTAYRLFACGDDVLVLTGTNLVRLIGLAKEMLSHPADAYQIKAGVIKLDAVDASILYDRWLMIVCTDGVSMFDLRKLLKSEENQYQHIGALDISEAWGEPVQFEEEQVNVDS